MTDDVIEFADAVVDVEDVQMTELDVFSGPAH
jgi:hypothetical protein